MASYLSGQYSLAVWWRGDDDLEFFTLRCRNEEQLKMWESQLNRLIQETANRRTSDRNLARLAQAATSSSPQIRSAHSSYAQERSSMVSNGSGYNSAFPQTASIGGRMRHPFAGEDTIPSSSATQHFSTGYAHGPQGYPPHEGFDVDVEDEYEDYPPATAGSPSGRGTPMGGQRRPDYPYPHSARYSGHATSPITSNGMGFQAPASARPIMSRNTGSFSSDASMARPALRSQFSTTRLRATYDQQDSHSRGASPMPTPTMHQPMRSRSASQPQAYNPPPQSIPPPLPTSNRADWTQSSMSGSKRGSGSSQSTDSADYSPHTSSSPITPYGSSESSLAGMSTSRSMRHMDQMAPPPLKEELRLSPPVKIKVHFHEDIFVIQVPRHTEYAELVDKVGKKIRLCGPRRDDGPLRVKYKDEDGDLVSLGSTEDVQMAFESFRPGNQVTLYVQ